MRSAPTETVTLSVPTVHCTTCKLNIEESLEQVHGVGASEVDLDARSVTVTYNASQTDVAAISATIADAGYPVVN